MVTKYWIFGLKRSPATYQLCIHFHGPALIILSSRSHILYNLHLMVSYKYTLRIYSLNYKLSFQLKCIHINLNRNIQIPLLLYSANLKQSSAQGTYNSGRFRKSFGTGPIELRLSCETYIFQGFCQFLSLNLFPWVFSREL